LFQTQKPAVVSIHIHAACDYKALARRLQRAYQRERFLLAVADHVERRVGLELFELWRKRRQIPAIAADVIHFRRKVVVSFTAMKNSHGVARFDQSPHNMFSDETCPANHQYVHEPQISDDFPP
jgi:hypothetical protein